jgi:hypothetical protein
MNAINAQTILARAQEGRIIVEDFTRLADSLEWSLGQQYWRDWGSNAFISESVPVPYAGNTYSGFVRRRNGRRVGANSRPDLPAPS